MAAQIHLQSATTVNYRLRIIIYQEGALFCICIYSLNTFENHCVLYKSRWGHTLGSKEARIKKGLGNFEIIQSISTHSRTASPCRDSPEIITVTLILFQQQEINS